MWLSNYVSVFGRVYLYKRFQPDVGIFIVFHSMEGWECNASPSLRYIPNFSSLISFSSFVNPRCSPVEF